MSISQDILDLQHAYKAATAAGNTDDAQLFAAQITQLGGRLPSEKSIEGFAQNLYSNVKDIGRSVLETPGALLHLQKGLVGNIPGVRTREDVLPSEAASTAADIQMVRNIPGAIGRKVTDIAKEAYEHPEQIPEKVGNWMYEHPADVGLLAAGPVTKGLLKGAELARGAEAARLATGATSAAERFGATARAAEQAAKITPWLNPLTPGEKLLKIGTKGVGSTLRYFGNVVDPYRAELNRMLPGASKREILDYLEANVQRMEPFVYTGEPAPSSMATSAAGAAVPVEQTIIGEAEALPPSRAIGKVTAAGAAADAGSRTTRGTAEVGPDIPPTPERPSVAVEYPGGWGYEDIFAPYRGAGETAAPAGAAGRIYAAMEQTAARLTPETNARYMQRAIDRGALREQVVRETAATPERLAQMAAEAKAAGGIPYETARNIGRDIDLRPVNNMIGQMIGNNQKNRKLVDALTSIKRNLKTAAGTFETSPKNVASIIDDLKGMIGDRNNAFIKDQLVGVKDALYKQFPEYAEADALYKKTWAPVHQQQIGAYLENILREKGPEAYQKAFADMRNTVKKATGMKLFKNYGQVFEGAEGDLVNLHSVNDDIVSEMSYLKAASDPHARAAVKDLFDPEAYRGIAMLNRWATVTQSILRRAQGHLTYKEAQKMALDMLKPETAVPELKRAITKEEQLEKLGTLTRKGISAYASQPAGVTYLGVKNLGDMARQYRLEQENELDNMGAQYNVPFPVNK